VDYLSCRGLPNAYFATAHVPMEATSATKMPQTAVTAMATTPLDEPKGLA
jgi:hypothetical protein